MTLILITLKEREKLSSVVIPFVMNTTQNRRKKNLFFKAERKKKGKRNHYL